MIPLLLAGVFACCVVGAWASFTDRVRQSDHYVGIMVAVSTATGLMFALGCKWLDDKPRIFVFSLWYDVMMATAYYALPIVLFGCKVQPAFVVGAVLVVSGLLVVHYGG